MLEMVELNINSNFFSVNEFLKIISLVFRSIFSLLEKYTINLNGIILFL